MPNQPATYSAAAIGQVFQSVVDEVQKVYAHETGQPTGPDSPSVLINAVDLELNFKTITINEKGWVLFGKDTGQSQMKIRLATRLTPPAISPPPA